MSVRRELHTPSRTIMTPGPVEVDPRVLRVMGTPVVGQFDPAFTNIMNETMAMLRELFQTENRWAYPIDGTSRAGIEAVLASVIEPGDSVLIPIYGRFGLLLTEIAERYGAKVLTMECEWGKVFDPEDIIQEIQQARPKIVAMVHGETSTGRIHPLREIGKACRAYDALFIVDAVATVGGCEIKVDDWKIDAAIGGTQKCLSVPSGMAPITYNDRVADIIAKRKKVERGIATQADSTRLSGNRPIISNYFDLSQLEDYWSERRLNHHTEATSMLYALREGVRLVLEEGLEERFERHRVHEQALQTGIKGMGLELFGDESCKMPVVTCVQIPEGIDGEYVRNMLLTQFGIEIASSFGPLAGKIWRIGTMGYSCRKENVLFVLAGLEAVLLRHGAAIEAGKALQEVLHFYEETETKAVL
ncbi:pyridoxal-phosphate-dependent aminotransferase family protein [Bacillus atrophaeus]|uniref:pyridoxal-phosphate-dependent aminotransferase family protein n=1 Tax=Bacillus atrophaeus TaxID=1452 RepID=UPI00227F034E|nr:alanine--glyoxylate aminotransferase family protein [Bacillus atrophaeus]MCY8960592.1 alanine--glyoxylate aminotransferase family protein [Bacillus atrophaeus]MCY8962283.1 alanine--glyoxylate aminotransferase family protein [Bacillus atrophaeus]MCY9438912.1 alanine--glyoxylate aminotransferase family protein [Bacillus atrophaeus]MEC0649783.1 alanine--glyoxylate aminotransferase family protein [Bacillus atrophaeus]